MFRQGAFPYTLRKTENRSTFTNMNSTIWGKPNGNCGACGKACTTPLPDKIWAPTNTGISLDMTWLKEGQRGICSSLSTEGTCEWKKGDLRSLQATLSSSGCNGSWVAPLWITPPEGDGECQWSSHGGDQNSSGEIDIFERGCSKADGYLLSYGWWPQLIKTGAWKQQGRPDLNETFTAFMRFEPPQQPGQGGTITTYKCPATLENDDLSLLTDADLQKKCGPPTDVETQYYSRTARNGDECRMHLVSDIWNKAKTGCHSGDDPNLPCKFSVSGLKLRFKEGGEPEGWRQSVCSALLPPP